MGFEKYKSNQNQRALREREQSLLNAILINASLLNMEGSVREVLGKHTVLKKKEEKRKSVCSELQILRQFCRGRCNQFVVTVVTVCRISI